MILGLVATVAVVIPSYRYIALESAASGASTEIKDLADNLGFRYDGKLLFYRAHPELVDADVLQSNCPNDASDSVEFGCYLPSENKIYILHASDQEVNQEEYTTAAHEMLHVAWHKLTTDEQSNLSIHLKKVLNDANNVDSAGLQTTMKTYPEGDAVLNSELHSFMGSEFAVLDIELDLHFSKYFTDRQVSVQKNKEFDETLTAKLASLDQESSRLDQESARLDKYKAEHLDNFDYYFDRAIYYGDTYAYNRNVDAYNKNLEYYKPQVTKYNTDIAAYNVRIDEYNALLASFRPSQSALTIKQPTQ